MPVPHPAPLSQTSYSAAELLPDNDAVVMLDQRRLPLEEVYERYTTPDEVAVAIRDMVVRGAPAIGIAAAYGVVLAANVASEAAWLAEVEAACARIREARPTAVNLMWAIDRMRPLVREVAGRARVERVERLAAEARAIHVEDREANRTMGALGAERVPDGATILTHCNAGALATGGLGTALAVIRAAHAAGKRVRVFADETRPYLQGARLTSWELARDGIDVTVIADNAAGSLFARGAIDLVVVGTDRVAANGDIANKIGTYSVAVLTHHHVRPFYVAAPWSTVDVRCPSGDAIPIEQRPGREITHVKDVQLVGDGIAVLNPSFDVTPARLIRAIFTERGVIDPVGPEQIALLEQGR